MTRWACSRSTPTRRCGRAFDFSCLDVPGTAVELRRVRGAQVQVLPARRRCSMVCWAKAHVRRDRPASTEQPVRCRSRPADVDGRFVGPRCQYRCAARALSWPGKGRRVHRSAAFRSCSGRSRVSARQAAREPSSTPAATSSRQVVDLSAGDHEVAVVCCGVCLIPRKTCWGGPHESGRRTRRLSAETALSVSKEVICTTVLELEKAFNERWSARCVARSSC